MTCSAHLLIVFMSLVIAQPISAQSLAGDAPVKALRDGGYVIVMRHASSPREVPNRQTANPDNVTLERQLDEAGRAASVAMGRALRDLKIPVGEVLTSPTYRALETVRLAQLADPRTQTELGDGGRACRALQMVRRRGSAVASLTCLPEQTQSS
jgi:phosphohistidine phosphatase SixA